MISITFIDHQGSPQQVQAEPGQSLMEVAVSQQLAGIVGECGGGMACGSCHLYIDEGWQQLTGSPSDLELCMIEVSTNFRPSSRLGCQVTVTTEMDGLVVRTPKDQLV